MAPMVGAKSVMETRSRNPTKVQNETSRKILKTVGIIFKREKYKVKVNTKYDRKSSWKYGKEV